MLQLSPQYGNGWGTHCSFWHMVATDRGWKAVYPNAGILVLIPGSATSFLPKAIWSWLKGGSGWSQRLGYTPLKKEICLCLADWLWPLPRACRLLLFLLIAKFAYLHTAFWSLVMHDSFGSSNSWQGRLFAHVPNFHLPLSSDSWWVLFLILWRIQDLSDFCDFSRRPEWYGSLWVCHNVWHRYCFIRRYRPYPRNIHGYWSDWLLKWHTWALNNIADHI